MNFRRIGGGYGQKWAFYPEEILVPLLSILTNRPIKWVETRREHMTGTIHAREQTHHIEAAVRRDGTILGVKDKIVANIGAAYPTGGLASIVTTGMFVPGAYRIANYEGQVQGVVTNKTPYGAHRGFGKSEACFVIERMVGPDRGAARYEPGGRAAAQLHPPGRLSLPFRHRPALRQRPVRRGVGQGAGAPGLRPLAAGAEGGHGPRGRYLGIGTCLVIGAVEFHAHGLLQRRLLQRAHAHGPQRQGLRVPRRQRRRPGSRHLHLATRGRRAAGLVR